MLVCLCRLFAKQRSTIEKDYSQSLLRLVQQFMTKRDIKDPPDISTMDRTENRFVQSTDTHTSNVVGEPPSQV